MDYEKAEADLVDYMRHVSECQKLPVLTKERRAALKSLNIEAIGVNRILASLTPGPRIDQRHFTRQPPGRRTCCPKGTGSDR